MVFEAKGTTLRVIILPEETFIWKGELTHQSLHDRLTVCLFGRERIFLVRLPALSGLIILMFFQSLPWVQSVPATITDPIAGQILLGTINISGSISQETYRSADLSFSFSDDSPATWFPIAAFNGGFFDGILASWDTTKVTDGNYSLRLRIVAMDGSIMEFITKELQIRNYSQPEAHPESTPAAEIFPSPSLAVPIATLTPTRTPHPTPTYLSTPTKMMENTATLSEEEISSSVLIGSGAVVSVFMILLFYTMIRKNDQ